MRATALPEHRSRMLDWYANDLGHDSYLQVQMSEGVFDKAVDRRQAETLLTNEVNRWRLADLYFVTEDMSNLAKSAAQTMPSFTLHRDDLPAEFGFMYFATPLGSSGEESEQALGVIPVVGCLWGTGWVQTESGDQEGVWLSFYTDTEIFYQRVWEKIQQRQAAGEEIPPAAVHRVRQEATLKGPFTYDDEILLPYGEGDVVSFEDDSHEQWAYTVRCAWLLMQQTVAAIHEERPDRPSRRRMQRAGHVEPKPVRVVSLRYSSTSGEHSTDREYHHRWLVKGHWRKQVVPLARPARAHLDLSARQGT